MTDEPTTAENPNQYSPLHPHEPEVAPVFDRPGRCLICVELVLKANVERLEKERDRFVLMLWPSSEHAYAWYIGGQKVTVDAGHTWQDGDGTIPPIAYRKELKEVEAQRDAAAQHLEWLLRAHAELVPPDYAQEWDQWMLASYQDSLKAAKDFLASLDVQQDVQASPGTTEDKKG